MNRTILIIGCAPNLIDDFENACALIDGEPAKDFDLMAIGCDAVDKIKLPLKYVATFHPEDIDGIYRKRRDAGGNDNFILIGHLHDGVTADSRCQLIIPHISYSGSSAHLGAKAAIQEGYTKIILCGCPLSDGVYKAFQRGWTVWAEANPAHKEMVKSMSGWTADFLGKPEKDWIINN